MPFGKLKELVFGKPALCPVVVDLAHAATATEPTTKPLYDEKELDLVLGTLDLIKFMILEANQMTGGIHTHECGPRRPHQFHWEKWGWMVMRDLDKRLRPFTEFLPKV